MTSIRCHGRHLPGRVTSRARALGKDRARAELKLSSEDPVFALTHERGDVVAGGPAELAWDSVLVASQGESDTDRNDGQAPDAAD